MFHLALVISFLAIVDPLGDKTKNSVVKFFEDLFGEQETLSDLLFSDPDRRIVIEIISRELSDRSCTAQVRSFLLLPRGVWHVKDSIDLEYHCVFIPVRIDSSTALDDLSDMSSRC